MPIGPKRMPFFEHIAELRQRLIVIALTLFIGSLAAYLPAWRIFEFVMAPITPFVKGGAWNYFGPFEGFGLRFKVAFYGAVVVCSPIIIWQILAFFLPALKKQERRYVVPTLLAAMVFFIGGVTFAYTVILGPAFHWMLTQGGGVVENIADASKFFQGASLLMIGFGVGFELPIVVFYLVLFGIVPYKKLRENWRISYVLIMVVASVATPDWSPVTMGALFGALLALYEGSMLVARVLLRKRIRAQIEAEAA